MFICIDQDDHIYIWTHFIRLYLYTIIIPTVNKGAPHRYAIGKGFCTYSTSF